MNKKIMLGVALVVSFCLVATITFAATRDIVQIPEKPFAKLELENATRPDPTEIKPDMSESGTPVDQVASSVPITSEVETTSTQSEHTIVVTENTTAAQVSEATTLEDIRNTQTDFQVELWTDRKDGQYHIGNDLVIYLKANKDSRVTLFDVGTSGKVHIIFPNEYQKDNSIKAGQTYRIPAEDAKWTFKLQGPAGKNILKAIATIEDVQILAQTDTKKAGIFQEINNSEKQLAKDIGIALKPINSMQWTEVGTELIIMN